MRKDLGFLWDIVFYFLLPIILWEIGREYLPDYIAMIISSLPGIFYSFQRWFQTGKLYFTRVFLLINIVAELSIDLLSGSALQLLWNTAFYSLVLCFIYLVSCILNKPLFLYFSLDLLVQQGYDRQLSKEVFVEKAALSVLKKLTFINGLRELIYAMTLMHQIKIMGVGVYTFSILLDQLFTFLISVISMIGFIYLYKLLNEIKLVKKIGKPARGMQKRAFIHWCYFYFERCFFFYSNNS
ncbi:MAG: VC0807 family protein [Bacillota bacterium]|nr:VC0807 family protein [Bacillota bacterium]